MAKKRKTTNVWKVMGRSQYGLEEVDSFPTLAEARKMIKEYRLAYGAGWSMFIRFGREKILVK